MKTQGFTLIETVMIIVVASVAIPVLIMALGRQARLGMDAELQVAALNLGQALMEEIVSKRWDETPGSYSSVLGPEGEESRTQCTGTSATPFDDVDDYNGYSETCTLGGVEYTKTVTVCYVQSTDLDACQGSTTDYKRIKVTVSTDRLGSMELVTLAVNY